MNDQQVSELVRGLDPARDASGPHELPDFRAEADLARIMTRKRRPRPVPAWLVVVATVAAVATTLLVVARPWSGGEPEPAPSGPRILQYQVVDSRPAAAQLREFAARVRALPPEPVTGPVQRISTQWAGVTATQEKSGEMTAAFSREDLVRYVTQGRSYLPASNGLTPSAVSWPKGVSTDPTILRRQLATKVPAGSTYAFLSTIEDLQRETIPGPALRAAILTVLAGEPGITAEGITVDRLGRPATAYSWADVYDQRHYWLFDPTTGVLLEIDQFGVPTGKAKHHPLTSYEIYDSRTYVTKVPR